MLTSLASALKEHQEGRGCQGSQGAGGQARKLSVKPVKYAGREGQGDRVVVVELFTGSECPPCLAADLAFDALEQTYTPKDVVLLEYHLHIPRPDPLTNTDSVERQEYYDVDPDADDPRERQEGGGRRRRQDRGRQKYEEVSRSSIRCWKPRRRPS